MDTNSRRESKNTKKCLKSHLEDVRLEDNKIEQVFPWLSNFNKDIHSCAGSRNYEHLERLLFLYTQNILSSVTESKLSDKIDLMKNHINKMLIFFHMYWLDIKQQNIDYSQYLNKISALLNVYIDMELETSSHVVKDSSKVAAKILAALFIYLNNSEKHIFRILLRNKHTTKKYKKVCNHIFMKSFTNLKIKTTSITDVDYIRYLLVFKMWIKMEETRKKKQETKKKKLNLSNKKEEINELALMLLGSRMPKLQDELLKFVPKPMSEENETLWLIQSNLFDKQVHEQFLLFEDKMDNSATLQCTKTIHVENCSKSQKHQMNSSFRPKNNGGTSEQKINKCLDDLRNNDTLPNNKSNKNKFLETLQKSESRSFKSLKKKNRGKKNKSGIIDLTGDDKVKRKKTKRNSKFLKEAKKQNMLINIIKKVRSKNHINSSQYSKLVNTNVKKYFNEDNKNLEEKNCLESKSVDIKSNDSTEDCTSVSNNTCVGKEDENINKMNMLKKSKLNCVSSCMTIGNVTSSCNNSITQNNSTLTSQEENAMETIPLFKTCQNNVANQQNHSFDFKQKLSTSTDCAMQCKSCMCCNIMQVMENLNISIIDCSSQIKEMIKMRQVNRCPKCYTQTDCKLSFLNNDINKYDYLLNHTDITTENRMQLDDKCIVSTTFTEDQVADSPLHNQHVNFVKINDCDSAVEYFEAAKEQQKESDSFILNDRLHSSTFAINSFDTNPNVKIDCNSKRFFSKKEETDEITNYVDLKQNIIKNIQNKTLLEDFFCQSFEQSKINLTDVLNNSKDTCIVSTTSIEDQIIESSLNSQHVNSDNRRKCVYEDRRRSDCDTSMSSELYTDFLEVDSKEVSEIMKTNCINDENISFSHFLTLEDILNCINDH